MLCSKCGKDNKTLVYCEYCKAPLSYIHSEKPALLSTKDYAATMEYAGIILRGTAFLMDIIILAFLEGLLGLVGLVLLGITSIILGQELLSLIIMFGFPWIVMLVYFNLQEMSHYQATIGKRNMKIIVCDLCGNRITARKAILRNAIKNIYILPIIFTTIFDTMQKGKEFRDLMSGMVIIIIGIYIISFIIYYLTPDKRALHDIVAGTVVIKE